MEHTHADTHAHTQMQTLTDKKNSKGENPSLKLKQIFQPASSPEFCNAAKPNVYLTSSCSCFGLLPMMLTTESKSNTIREAFSIKCNFNGCKTSDL